MPGIIAFQLKKQWKIITTLGDDLIYPNETNQQCEADTSPRYKSKV